MNGIENWWTRKTKREQDMGEDVLDPTGRAAVRVRHYLGRYVELAEACYCGDSALDKETAFGTAQQKQTEARWVELVCIKADLDRALKRITKQQARAVVLVLVGGYTEREAAWKMGIGRPRVNRYMQAGVKRIAEILAG